MINDRGCIGASPSAIKPILRKESNLLANPKAASRYNTAAIPSRESRINRAVNAPSVISSAATSGDACPVLRCGCTCRPMHAFINTSDVEYAFDIRAQWRQRVSMKKERPLLHKAKHKVLKAPRVHAWFRNLGLIYGATFTFSRPIIYIFALLLAHVFS